MKALDQSRAAGWLVGGESGDEPLVESFDGHAKEVLDRYHEFWGRVGRRKLYPDEQLEAAEIQGQISFAAAVLYKRCHRLPVRHYLEEGNGTMRLAEDR